MVREIVYDLICSDWPFNTANVNVKQLIENEPKKKKHSLKTLGPRRKATSYVYLAEPLVLFSFFFFCVKMQNKESVVGQQSPTLVLPSHRGY